jgi:ABC-type nickel/cobalt efflux system permease component RcnA
MTNKIYLQLGLICILLNISVSGLAHPLGNFSLNHYTLIELNTDLITTQHIIDFAEFPSFKELYSLDVDDDNVISSQEMKLFKDNLYDLYLKQFMFSVTGDDNKSVEIKPEIVHREVVLSMGQGSLTCLQVKIACEIRHESLSKLGAKTFSFRDAYLPRRQGVKEIRIKSAPGVKLRPENITTYDNLAAPIPLDKATFVLSGMDAAVSYEVKDVNAPSTDNDEAELFSFIDPASIPIYPLSPDSEGNYKILKSPAGPSPEVQKQVAMLQPRNVISASGVLSGFVDANAQPDSSSTILDAASTDKKKTTLATKPGGYDAQWANLIGVETLSPTIVFFAIFVSLIAGASHALSPGHGKTVVAAYLVGSKGTVLHAIFLGIVVTLTHVSSVLVLGAITLFFSQYILPETLYPIIEASSGLLIIVIGGMIFFRRYGAYQANKVMISLNKSDVHDHSHDHSHEQHSHEQHSHEPHDHHSHEQQTHEHKHHNHDHHAHGAHIHADHEHGPHTHTHEIPADANWRDLLILGVTGGIVPCPTALVVLLGAIGLHRPLFGMMLILFFSLGLSSVLIAIGIIMVSAKHVLDKYFKGDHSFTWLQIASPILVTLLGLVILLRGLHTGGIITLNFLG